MEHALALLFVAVLFTPLILHWWHWDPSTNIFDRAMGAAGMLVATVVAAGVAEAYSWLIAIPAWLALMFVFEFFLVLLEDIFSLAKRILYARIGKMS